jgi:hypothetical protein
MRKIKIGHHVVEVYSEPSELKINEYKLYTKQLAIASEIGDDFAAVDSKLNDIFLVAGDREKTMTEVNNLRQTLYNIYNVDQGVDSMLFAIMVHSIDGNVVTDKSNEGLERIMKTLSQISQKELKKKTVK